MSWRGTSHSGPQVRAAGQRINAAGDASAVAGQQHDRIAFAALDIDHRTAIHVDAALGKLVSGDHHGRMSFAETIEARTAVLARRPEAGLPQTPAVRDRDEGERAWLMSTG